MTPVNISDEQPPNYFFNIIICCNMCPKAVEQATQATTRENLSSGFPTKRVLNQCNRLNRLAWNWNFSRSKCRYDSSKKQTTKMLMRLRGCKGWSAPLLLQITEDRFLQSRSNCYPWTLRKHGKYDNSDIIVICAVSSKHLQCECRHIKSYPAGDCFLYNTTLYTKVNMVFIELYKPRVTHMKYTEGK